MLQTFILLQQSHIDHYKCIQQTILTDFSNQRIIDSGNVRTKFLNEQALYIKKISDELTSDIQKMKVEMVMKVDKVDETKAMDLVVHPMKVNRKDDYDGPTHFFGTSDPPGTKGKAHDLKIKLNEFRSKCMAVVDKVIEKYPNKNQIRLDLENKLNIIAATDPKDNKEFPTWEMEYFYHLPLAAALTELTKWQNFVKGAEGDMLNFLWNDISNGVFKFDQVKVAVIPKSNFITSGSNFEADVFLAAYSTNGSNLPTITYGSFVDTGTMNVTGGVVLEKDKFTNGVGKVSFPVSGIGEKTFAGTLQMKDPSGNIKTLPFSTTYNVAPPSASIAPTNLNVVYYGTDNPFSISVPGVAPNQIIVSAAGATVTGSNGNYKINPSTGSGNITVNVSARMADGTIQKMGTQQFRVKRVPDPVIVWCGQYSGGTISKTRAAGSPLIPDMSGFLFPVSATITKVSGFFTRGGNVENFDFTGNVPTGKVKDYILSSSGTKKITFESIKVNVPGGTRTLTASYTIVN